MMFGECIDHCVKTGDFIARRCWVEGQRVNFHIPDARSDMNTPYFYIEAPFEGLVDSLTSPWLPDVWDITAHDWIIINGNKTDMCSNSNT